MRFEYRHRDQVALAAESLSTVGIKIGTQGEIRALRSGAAGAEYLVKFVGHANLRSCSVTQLSRTKQ